MSCVFRKKSKQKNLNRKLVGMSCGEKCVYEGKSKKKTHAMCLKGEKRAENTNWKLVGMCCGRKKVSEKSIAWTRKEKNKEEKIDVKFKN